MHARAVQGLVGPDPPAVADQTKPNLLPTEPIAPMVNDGFYSPKTKIGGSGIESPPLKSKKPKQFEQAVFFD